MRGSPLSARHKTQEAWASVGIPGPVEGFRETGPLHIPMGAAGSRSVQYSDWRAVSSGIGSKGTNDLAALMPDLFDCELVAMLPQVISVLRE